MAGADRGYGVETVANWVMETQTGFQRRRPEPRIDETQLQDGLAAVHVVGDLERTMRAIWASVIALDRGEASVWAYVLGRDDDWTLCGSDNVLGKSRNDIKFHAAFHRFSY